MQPQAPEKYVTKDVISFIVTLEHWLVWAKSLNSYICLLSKYNWRKSKGWQEFNKESLELWIDACGCTWVYTSQLWSQKESKHRAVFRIRCYQPEPQQLKTKLGIDLIFFHDVWTASYHLQVYHNNFAFGVGGNLFTPVTGYSALFSSV